MRYVQRASEVHSAQRENGLVPRLIDTSTMGQVWYNARANFEE